MQKLNNSQTNADIKCHMKSGTKISSSLSSFKKKLESFIVFSNFPLIEFHYSKCAPAFIFIHALVFSLSMFTFLHFSFDFEIA